MVCSSVRNFGCLALGWTIFGVVGDVELKGGDMVAIVVDCGREWASGCDGKSSSAGGEVIVVLALVD